MTSIKQEQMDIFIQQSISERPKFAKIDKNQLFVDNIFITPYKNLA
jgi:hypothetical protein